MKISSLPILALFIAVTTTEAVTSNKTIISYDPAQLLSKIFNANITTESRQRGYGFVNFDGQLDSGIDPDSSDPGQYGLIDSDRDQRPLRFEDDYDQLYDPNLDTNYNDQNGNRPLKFEDENQDLASNNGGPVTFQDDNKISDQGNKQTRKRKRRRKPKNGVLPYPGANFGSPPGNPGYPGPVQGGYGLNPYGNPGYPGSQPYRRPRRPRPRPSIASEALSSVTEALTSIARYDDYQCVPRLLCEAAGGGGLGENGVLQSIAGIQPLLTLLSAYNGLSTSPLFVFGRAVFLGMTSKGNTGTCRYAYPQCPTDPEQLIYYLNNHNGGFFRFFNAPQLGNQNLQQFYNQLGQGYGIYQPDHGQGYGYPQDPNAGQSYGLYPGHNPGYNPGYPGDSQNGLQRPGPYDRPGLYNHQDYGTNYAYGYNTYGSGNKIRFKDSNKIEKRIQNKPVQHFDDSFEDDDVKTKWHFPEDDPDNGNNDIKYQIGNNNRVRDSRTLKFPEDGQSFNNQKDSNRKGKRLNYPEYQNNQYYHNNRKPIYTNYNDNRYQTTTYSYNNGQNNQNYYNNRPIIYTNNNYKYPTTTYNYNDNNSNYNNGNYQNGQHYYNNGNNNYQNNQNYYNNRQNMYNDNYKYPKSTVFNNEEYVFDYKHNFYVKKDKDYVNNGNNNNFKRSEDDGSKTVYVVRGNGDPSKPEIVKLRPGQSVY